MHRVLISVACIFGLAAGASQVHAAAYTFQTIDGPNLPGGTMLKGINDRGQVIGQETTYDASGTETATDSFIYSNGSSSVVPNVLSITAINNNNQSVGSVYFPNFTFNQYLNTSGSLSVVKTPSNAPQGYKGNNFRLTGINDLGQLLGNYSSLYNYFGSIGNVIIDSSGNATPFDLPNGQIPGVFASGINNLDQVTGLYVSPSNLAGVRSASWILRGP